MLLFSGLISAFLLVPAIAMPFGWSVLGDTGDFPGFMAPVRYIYGGFCLLFPIFLVGFVTWVLGQGLFGFRPGMVAILIGFFVPVALHWQHIGQWGMLKDGFARLGLLFVAALAAKLIGAVLRSQAPALMEQYRMHMSHMLGGGDTSKYFLWVVFYALLNQAISFYYAARALLSAPRIGW